MGGFEPARRATAHDPSPYALGSDRAFQQTGSDGRLSLRLEWWRDELWLIDSNDLVVPCDRPGMTAIGMYGFDVRGIRFHKAAARTGDFRPGRRIELVREPNNRFDANAVGVRAAGAETVTGYINKGKAGTVAKLLDQGKDLYALCLRGTGPGTMPAKISILAATPEAIRHLCRNLRQSLPEGAT